MKIRSTAVCFRQILGLMAFGWAVSGAAQTPASSSEGSQIAALRRASEDILRRGVFPKEIQPLAVRAAGSSHPGLRNAALQVLASATSRGLFPAMQLLNVLGPHLSATSPDEAERSLKVVQVGLGLDPKRWSDWEQSWLRIKRTGNSDPGMSTDARRLALLALNDNDPGDRMLAGRVFVRSRSLNKESRIWVLSRVRGQIAGSRGEKRMYWALVERVVIARNRPSGQRAVIARPKITFDAPASE